jgi:hypothetical protein
MHEKFVCVGKKSIENVLGKKKQQKKASKKVKNGPSKTEESKENEKGEKTNPKI